MRSSKMESTSENAVQPRPSGLRQPQVRAATVTGNTSSAYLQDLTDSQHNARAQSQLPGLGKTGIPQKRIHAGVPQPDTKRKSLMERAGEPIKSHIPPTTPALARAAGALKGSSIASLNAQKPPVAGSTTRHAANKGSFANSMGPGTRPPSIARPSTSVGFSKSTTYTRSRANTRPGTVLGTRESDKEAVHPSQANGWEVNAVEDRIAEFMSQVTTMTKTVEGTLAEKEVMAQAIELAKSRANDLERANQQLSEQNAQLQSQVDAQRQDNYSLQEENHSILRQLQDEQRRHKYELEDERRAHKVRLDELRRELKAEEEGQERKHREALEAMERQHRAELADRDAQKSRELQELRAKSGAEQQDLNLGLLKKEREIQEMRSMIEGLKSDLDREQTIKENLRKEVAEMSTANSKLEGQLRALQAKIEFLESDSKQQSDSFAEMENRLQDALRIAEEARQKLIKEETERRVLFNKYQELKGNIRVMCRVRPVLDPQEGEEAKLAFPDTKTSTQIDVTGPEEKSSLGTISRKVIPFEFDRVFTPAVDNEEVFGEISQLVQSALDGYNVCIFCYGQTGSGKTYTMSSPDGMIPRATHMIYDTITKLKEKSWAYTMEGSFVEVYNEELHDLLTPPSSRDAPDGSGSGSRKKLEIRHDEARKQTTVLNCKTVALDSADKVEAMLRQAQANRSVAATKANERSSRSHSVFILKLVGENAATGERCEGTLNLVDLAGSERLKHSQAEGDRMKETQNINKSLACLGDVIEALGRGSAHVPYRNSKLTHLLQYSLGGNSKTLMFVMVSPLEAHLKETITSLRFATKVHNTHIGTAKSTKKLKNGPVGE
ncbi:hypothetical protein VTK26DRAFT_7476 [Humicola hyalothermophila]